MHIFTNSILASVPKTYSLDEVVAKRIIRKRKSDSEKTRHHGVMACSVKLVACPNNAWNLEMVSGENLIGRVDKFVSVLKIFFIL